MDEDIAKRPVDAAVGAAMDRLLHSVAVAGSPVRDIVDPLSRLAARGKRMRAALLLTGHAAAGGTRTQAAVRVAAALELFQVAALVHDDVLDDSDTRRGMPSAHRVIEGKHVASGWRGDPARFGTGAAILAGDLALMACMSELVAALAGVEASVAAEVGERFSTMASVCTAGQYLDLRLAAQPLEHLADEREAILVAMRSKTSSYTTEGPLALGAALAGLPPADVDAWAAVGVPLGLAFQLRDDVLGVVGASHQTGKPAGDDVREGKRTLLMAHGLSVTWGHDRAALLAGVGSSDPDAVARAVDVLVGSGAIEAVELEIASQADAARGLLSHIEMEDRHRAQLLAIFDATTARSA